MKLFWGFSLSFLLLSSALVSSAIFADEAISSTKSFVPNSETWEVVSNLQTGFGSFQDVQIPRSYDETVRLDGTAVEPESQAQGGQLLGLSLILASPEDRWQWVNRFEAIKLANLTVNLNNADSSYSAIEIETGVRFSNSNRMWVVETLMGIQNQYFTNISSGHILSGFYPKMRMMWNPTKNHQLALYLASIINPKFSYDSGKQDVALKNTIASSNTFGAHYEYRLRTNSAVQLGFKMNQSDVQIQSIQAYEAAGFSVLSSDGERKRLQLATAIVSIGFVTRW